MTIPPPDAPPPRRTRRPFPGRRHVPGAGPHPSTEGFVAVPDEAFARDLFDHRFYWEAHEVWEALWAPLPRADPEARWLQGLICAAAAVIKHHQGHREGGVRLQRRAAEHLDRAVAALGPRPHGIDPGVLLTRLDAFFADGTWPTLPEAPDGG